MAWYTEGSTPKNMENDSGIINNVDSIIINTKWHAKSLNSIEDANIDTYDSPDEAATQINQPRYKN